MAEKKRTRKAKPVEEFFDGDVIDTTEVEEPIKNDTVTVCANLPRDTVFEVVDRSGNVQEILIKGNAGKLRGKVAGILPVGAFGITLNVPAEAWKQIQQNFKDDNRFKSGLIFSTTASKARKEAAERKDLRNGYEPIDPEKTKTHPNE